MDETNISWVLAAACLFAGIGIGGLGYHLLRTGTGEAQQLRRRLAERDKALSDLKDGLGDSLERIGQLAETLRQESQSLADETETAGTLLGAPSLRRQAMDAATPADAEPPAPRDYADGNRGTLSEDFGLKPSDEDAAPQPPRY